MCPTAPPSKDSNHVLFSIGANHLPNVILCVEVKIRVIWINKHCLYYSQPVPVSKMTFYSSYLSYKFFKCPLGYAQCTIDISLVTMMYCKISSSPTLMRKTWFPVYIERLELAINNCIFHYKDSKCTCSIFGSRKCEYQAISNRGLARHQKKAHEGVKHNCTQCGYQSTLKSNNTKGQYMKD